MNGLKDNPSKSQVLDLLIFMETGRPQDVNTHVNNCRGIQSFSQKDVIVVSRPSCLGNTYPMKLIV